MGTLITTFCRGISPWVLKMKEERYRVFQISFGSLVILIILLFFVNLYMTGATPLGWDTPKYINGMFMIKEGNMNEFLEYSVHRDHLLYSLLGGVFSIIFNVSPYYIEIYLPILLSIVPVFALFNLSKKWFKNREISLLTLLLTIIWYPIFNYPIYRHANLIGVIFLFVLFTYLPNLYEKEKVSKKHLVTLWILSLLGSLSHLHTFVFIWGILFLTALIPFLPKMIRVKLGLNFKIDGESRKKLMKRIFFLGSAPLFVFLLFLMRKGERVIYREKFSFDPFLYFLNRWRIEVFLDFGGYLIIFFFFGLILLARRNKKNQEFKFKENLLLVWCSVSLLLFCFSFPFLQLGVYARRALLSLPLPLIEALGVHKLFTVLKKKTPFQRLSSLGIHKKHTQMGVLFTGLVLVPMFGTGTLIYKELTPAPRHISEKTVNHLRWIGNKKKNCEEPVFVIFTSKKWTSSLAGYWEDWIKCYIEDYYIYPGIIKNLLASKRPEVILEGDALSLYKEMKEEGMLNNTKLKQHKVFILPEFYKHGNFNPNEEHLVPIPQRDIYRLQVPSSY